MQAIRAGKPGRSRWAGPLLLGLALGAAIDCGIWGTDSTLNQILRITP